jgi:hypothetical protein
MTTVCRKRLEEARANVTSLRFGNLCALAECFGWVFVQVRQLLAAIDELMQSEDL